VDLSGFNETDVREEIIAPLLRRLGYRTGSVNHIIRELSLSYPRISLGRKNKKKDPPLRGRADYILEVNSRLRWTIEAKGADVNITADDVEQAWTYANHTEVRAIYFALCNGKELVIYKTNESPDAPPVYKIDFENFENGLQQLTNLLGPEALLRDFPDVKLDLGKPLAPGLRSIARIANGAIHYNSNRVWTRKLTEPVTSSIINELQGNIEEGAIERIDKQLVAFMKVRGPTRSLQEFNDRMGFSAFEMTADADCLSCNPGSPTVFRYKNQLILPEGEELPELATWQRLRLPENVVADVDVEASGVYSTGLFSGSFKTSMQLSLGFEVELLGSFRIVLS
jgi:hypothetical protein